MKQNSLEQKRIERAKRILDSQILFDYFCRKWEVTWHEKFAKTYNFGNAIRKKIMHELWYQDLAEMQKRVRNFFRSGDAWVVEHKHPIFYFLKYHSRFKTLSKRLDNGILQNGQKTNCTYKIATHENFDVEREIEKYRNRSIGG